MTVYPPYSVVVASAEALAVSSGVVASGSVLSLSSSVSGSGVVSSPPGSSSGGAELSSGSRSPGFSLPGLSSFGFSSSGFSSPGSSPPGSCCPGSALAPSPGAPRPRPPWLFVGPVASFFRRVCSRVPGARDPLSDPVPAAAGHRPLAVSREATRRAAAACRGSRASAGGSAGGPRFRVWRGLRGVAGASSFAPSGLCCAGSVDFGDPPTLSGWPAWRLMRASLDGGAGGRFLRVRVEVGPRARLPSRRASSPSPVEGVGAPGRATSQ